MTSPQNALVKRAASLRQHKVRAREGAFLAEGADLVAAGLAAGRRPQLVFLRAERAQELAAALGLEAGSPPIAVYPVSERVAARISTLDTPPDVLAVFPLPEQRPLTRLLGPASPPKGGALREGGAPAGTGQTPAGGQTPPRSAPPLVVYADGVQDPGNLGTLLRAAVAFGATALCASPGSADVFGPKTVRASMGALFALPLAGGVELGELLEQLRLERVYGLDAHDGRPLADAALARPAVLVVGAERAGLSPRVRARVTDPVTIPMSPAPAGAVDSLNAGVAGAIALYEFARQARAADPKG